ncbi:hypothetical protein HN51_045849 [Arachis hypogaea]
MLLFLILISYYKKEKHVEVEEVPFEGSKERKPSSELDGLGLVRPILAKGTTFQFSDNKVPLEIKKLSQQKSNAENVNKSILKKPTEIKWTCLCKLHSRKSRKDM